MPAFISAWLPGDAMDYFWHWFYQQLEKQPEKDAEELRMAAQEAFEAPPGLESQESARLLQRKIGNQAMQRLLKMKDRLVIPGQTGKVSKPAIPAPESEKTVSPIGKAVPEQETKPGPILDTVIQEKVSESVDKKEEKAPDEGAKGSRPKETREPVTEKKAARALKQFLATLPAGGYEREWHTLAALFKELSNSMREKVIAGIVSSLKQIDPTVQRAFMKRLMTWKKSGNDDLAILLWLRLRFLAKAPVPAENGAGAGGNNE